MPTTKAQQRAVNKYIKNNYDRLNITLPAGQKAIVEAFARAHGDSINGVTNKALLTYMGLETWPETEGTSCPGKE